MAALGLSLLIVSKTRLAEKFACWCLCKVVVIFSDFNHNWSTSTNFSNTNIEFHENPFIGFRVITNGKTDWQT